jgi:hypothetical protein
LVWRWDGPSRKSVPEPVLILVLYILLGKRDRIRGKANGTALGVAAAIPVGILSPPAGAPGHVGYEAEERRVQILVGIGILVVGLAIVHALGQ